VFLLSPRPVLCCAVLCLQVSLESKGPEAFKTPKGVCVPFGSMELALSQRPAGVFGFLFFLAFLLVVFVCLLCFAVYLTMKESRLCWSTGTTFAMFTHITAEGCVCIVGTGSTRVDYLLQ
jgi:hypothetical protein